MRINEGMIDRPTSKLLDSNKNILKTTNSLNEVNGSDIYIDLSNLSKKSEDQFIKAFAAECKKIEGYENRVVYIDLNDWTNSNSMIDFLLRYIKSSPNTFKKDFAGIHFIFVNTINNNGFGLEVDKYQASEYSTLKNLMYMIGTDSAEMRAATGTIQKKSPNKQIVDPVKEKQKKQEQNKKELVKAINKAAEDAVDEEDVIDIIDSDENIIKILADIEEDEPGKPNINKARAARMSKVNDQFLKSSIGTTTVKSLIFDSKAELPAAHLKVSSINKDEWDNVKFANFEKSYDINKDLYSMLYSLSEGKKYPVSIRKITTEDTSTSMDYTILYKVECEDSFGKRFTLKFDIPKFINNRFMKLRGNEKIMSGQLMLLPCMKTDNDTVQIVSNYKKIFIRRYGVTGKSYPSSDRLIKSLLKYKGSKIKVTLGDNSLICTKYELPIDYIDLCTNLSKVETKTMIYFFNQDTFFKNYKAESIQGIPYGVEKLTSKVHYYTPDNEATISMIIAGEIMDSDSDFKDLYTATKPANRLNYSEASILDNKLPLVVMLGYYIGLTEVLKRNNINYRIADKRTRYDPDREGIIKFEDKVIIYSINYESSMLMNGLSGCDTENYSLADIDRRMMWLDFLDNYGGRLISDGLENFRDLFMDPITVEVCNDCKLPSDYIDLLIYSNNLLVDNKYNRHTDISGNRYRTNEIVAAYFYVVLSKSYEQYANSIRRGRVGPMTMKQSAVIDTILTSNISSDLSTLNPLLELTSASTTTFKGPSGMNSDRAYSLDKRTYDESMINKLALSTGFAANVGIDRQSTIDMDVEGVRGYIKNTDNDDMSVTKTFSMSEAVTPFGVTRDDPFRSAMTYIQTSKHSMRTKKSSPLLITNGADQAMPYLNSSTYAVKSEASGEVVELDKDHMLIKYVEPIADVQDNITGTASMYRLIDLKEEVRKNSDGGFYITIKLDTNMKLGQKFKIGEILAYDRYSFGNANEDDQLAYNLGVLTKVAIMNNDEGFEDSTSISNWMSEALASEVVTMSDTPPLSKNTNIYQVVKIGQPIQEGEPLIIYQNAFDEEDANLLLKFITDTDVVSDLGRIRIKSKYTGVIQDIKIYRTCEIEEMSESMQKIVKEYEAGIKKSKAMYNKYNIPGANTLDPNYKIDQTGRMKNVRDGILIEFYIKYNDKMSIGDKCVAQSANKGTVKDIFPVGLEPFTAYRPEEKINAIFAARSFNARMVTSVFVSGAINKVLIELDHQVKDIMGLKQIPLESVNDHDE